MRSMEGKEEVWLWGWTQETESQRETGQGKEKKIKISSSPREYRADRHCKSHFSRKDWRNKGSFANINPRRFHRADPPSARTELHNQSRRSKCALIKWVCRGVCLCGWAREVWLTLVEYFWVLMEEKVSGVSEICRDTLLLSAWDCKHIYKIYIWTIGIKWSWTGCKICFGCSSWLLNPYEQWLWVMHYISVICGQWFICFSSKANGVYLHYQLWFQLVVSLYIHHILHQLILHQGWKWSFSYSLHW